jgi:hypothetical protein
MCVGGHWDLNAVGAQTRQARGNPSQDNSTRDAIESIGDLWS